MEKAREQREAEGEIETEHPGYLGAQDTYYVGTIKGIGRIDQQTFIDTYSKVAFAKLYTTKSALTAADLLNDRVVPFFEEQAVPLLRILTDHGTEYCGSLQHHEYQLYLALEDIDHTKTKARSPQTNGICERLHRTLQDEFYQVAFRKSTSGPTAASIVTEAPRFRLSEKPSIWRFKRCWTVSSRPRSVKTRPSYHLPQLSLPDKSHVSD